MSREENALLPGKLSSNRIQRAKDGADFLAKLILKKTGEYPRVIISFLAASAIVAGELCVNHNSRIGDDCSNVFGNKYLGVTLFTAAVSLAAERVVTELEKRRVAQAAQTVQATASV